MPILHQLGIEKENLQRQIDIIEECYLAEPDIKKRKRLRKHLKKRNELIQSFRNVIFHYEDNKKRGF